jgi:hypothetical protein
MSEEAEGSGTVVRFKFVYPPVVSPTTTLNPFVGPVPPLKFVAEMLKRALMSVPALVEDKPVILAAFAKVQV